MEHGEQRTIVIDVHVDRRLMTILFLGTLAVVFSAFLMWGQRGVGTVSASPSRAAAQMPAPAPAAGGTREFYVSKTFHNGADASSACEPGFHMASMWEILDPSNLRYNTHLGFTQADSGEGPAADPSGWVRTGGSSTSSDRAGYASCFAYSSDSSLERGSVVWLSAIWEDLAGDIGNWQAGISPCDTGNRVWCVQD